MASLAEISSNIDVKVWIKILLVLLVLCRSGQAQGFVNLNFENATVSPAPVNGFGGDVDPAMAFPGWTVQGAQSILYNNRTLGNTMAALIGPSFPDYEGDTPLQGSYSAWLGTFQYPGQPTPSLSQTALVPANAQSIKFLSASPFDPSTPVEPLFGTVTLGGVALPLTSIGGTRFAADVSAFAGQIENLTFSGNIYFDNIQFSTSAVPEPSAFALGALGALLLGFRRWRK